jgi:hypothetical protein
MRENPIEQPPFHMRLDSEEVPELGIALGLYISDEAHEGELRTLARQILTQLEASPDTAGRTQLTLTPPQMKIMHAALRLRLEDTQREQADERAVLHRILDRMPDEHTMRAILIP